MVPGVLVGANAGAKVARYLCVAVWMRIVGPSLSGDPDQGEFGTTFRNDPANRQVGRTSDSSTRLSARRETHSSRLSPATVGALTAT